MYFILEQKFKVARKKSSPFYDLIEECITWLFRQFCLDGQGLKK